MPSVKSIPFNPMSRGGGGLFGPPSGFSSATPRVISREAAETW